MLRLAREAGENLTEAVKLAQATVEAAAAAAAASSKGGRRGSVAAPSAGVSLVADDGMRAREGWARAELAKLCLTGVSPDFVR